MVTSTVITDGYGAVIHMTYERNEEFVTSTSSEWIKMLFVVVTCLVFGLGACGGDPPDPAKIYADAGDKMAVLTAYHVTAEVESDQAVKLEIDIQPPRSYRYTSVPYGSLPTGDNRTVVITVDEETFMRQPGYTYFVGPYPRSSSEMGEFFQALWTDIVEIVYVDKEKLEHVAVHHLKGTVTPEIRRLVDTESTNKLSGMAEIWVGVNDSIVYRIKVRGWGEESTFTMSQFNGDINITTPDNPRSFDWKIRRDSSE